MSSEVKEEVGEDLKGITDNVLKLNNIGKAEIVRAYIEDSNEDKVVSDRVKIEAVFRIKVVVHMYIC